MPTPDNPLLWGLPEGLIENPNLRTQHAKTFENPDGSLTSLLAGNLHYQARPGEWEPQNYDFLVSGANQDSDRHWFRTRVSDVGIEVLDKETEVGMRWLLPSRPSVAGNLASHTADGVNWSHKVGPRRLKFEGTVATPLGAKTYTFPYEPLNAASDFTVVNGAAVSSGIRISAPYIIGANRITYTTAGWTLLPGARLSFSFDDTSLPAEAYPYVIDPNTTLQPGSAGFGTRIHDDNPTTNDGDFVSHFIGDGTGASGGRYRSLIKFDVSSITSTHTVSDATLSLFENAAYDSAGVGTWAVEFHRLLRNWVESEATWEIFSTGNDWGTDGAGNTTSDRSSTLSATLTMDGTSAGAFVDWNDTQLTADVQNFVDGSVSNYGWVVDAPSAENQSGDAGNNFDSDDTSTSARRPKLVVVHSLVAFTPRAIMF